MTLPLVIRRKIGQASQESQLVRRGVMLSRQVRNARGRGAAPRQKGREALRNRARRPPVFGNAWPSFGQHLEEKKKKG